MTTIRLFERELKMCIYHGDKSSIGGTSQVRGDDRSKRLLEDQIIGQIGNLALSKYLFGSSMPYCLSRSFANRYPTEGDGGADIPMTNLDVKASRMRYSKDPLDYHLLVRPKERHDDWIYILCIVDIDREEDGSYARAHLVGWISDSELPDTPSEDRRFAGAYAVPGRDLHPMMPIRWENLEIEERLKT